MTSTTVRRHCIDLISGSASLIGCFVTFLASKSLIYDKNIKMKMKSNHPFVESPSPFRSLTIVNHHPSQLLLLPSRFVPHLRSSPRKLLKLCRVVLKCCRLEISHFVHKDQLKNQMNCSYNLCTKFYTKFILVPRPRAYIIVPRGRDPFGSVSAASPKRIFSTCYCTSAGEGTVNRQQCFQKIPFAFFIKLFEG